VLLPFYLYHTGNIQELVKLFAKSSFSGLTMRPDPMKAEKMEMKKLAFKKANLIKNFFEKIKILEVKKNKIGANPIKLFVPKDKFKNTS
jgi:hypothetical protein